jgi:formylglycine-generating enzyme required for sulfatase activity
VRAGRHSVRIPLYAQGEVPTGAVLVPAGRVPARNRHGSLSEAIAPEDERRVDHDFAITNLVTQGEWLAFLASVAASDGEDAALARAPSSWRATRSTRAGGERFCEADGAALDLAAPVRFVGYDDVRAFLAQLARPAHARRPTSGARLPTLNEIKRAYRGNDARIFPWGDATARRPSVAAFQFLGYLPAPAPMPSVPEDSRFADRSPFSSPDGPAVFHLVGNVTELVSIGVTAADRAPIVGAFPATRGEDPADDTLGDRYFVTFGLPYDRPAPTNGDVIGVERWRSSDDPARKPRLPYGFRWVVPLRTVSNA